MTDLIGRRKRKNRRRFRYGEDYEILSERNGSSRKREELPMADRHIDGA